MIATLEQRMTRAERGLFAELELDVRESFVKLERTRLVLRVLEHGAGSPVLLLHGALLTAAAWAPLIAALPGYRMIALDLPGHGLSEPFDYRGRPVRDHVQDLIEDMFDVFGLSTAPVIGHSLGAMFVLWHAAAGGRRASALVSFGSPGRALPGARGRMPLSLLTLRAAGPAGLRARLPRAVHRLLLTHALGPYEVEHAPRLVVEAARLSARRPDNARSTASLMRAIDRFPRPRPEGVLTEPELARIDMPTTFVWGVDDPYLPPAEARPAIALMPSATLHELFAGHAPWLVAPVVAAALVRRQLSPAVAYYTPS